MSAIIENKASKFREDPGDPWVARMHHVDHYPAGNGEQGVREEDKRTYTGKRSGYGSSWRMYYGKTYRAFPCTGIADLKPSRLYSTG